MDRSTAWTLLYGSILGIARHPRAIEEAQHGGQPLRSAKDCALEADDALAEWDQRFNNLDVTTPPPE